MTGIGRVLRSSMKRVGQKLIALVFKCRHVVQSTDGDAEASNKMVCVLSFGKCQIVYETNRRMCQEQIHPLLHRVKILV